MKTQRPRSFFNETIIVRDLFSMRQTSEDDASCCGDILAPNVRVRVRLASCTRFAERQAFVLYLGVPMNMGRRFLVGGKRHRHVDDENILGTYRRHRRLAVAYDRSPCIFAVDEKNRTLT